MPASAFLLDVTRIVSRLGKGALTGIDRVELAYLRYLLGQDVPVYGLTRTPAGVLVLPVSALKLIADWAQGGPLPGPIDLIGRIARRKAPDQARAETQLRHHALRRLPVALLGQGLRRLLAPGTVYLNVGHANLSPRVLRGLHRARLRVAVMLHDTIPLESPEYARADQIAVFARRVAAVSAHADVVIHTAHTTRLANERHLAKAGRVPPGVVAPLAVDMPKPDLGALPPGLMPSEPYFVVLGTIEPRKNHALLLDVWDALAAEKGPLPKLLVIGNRGWAKPALFARLDRGVAGVQVLSGLGDQAVATLVAGARALLFPSFAEGFGLPAIEAMRLKTPVIASDLPIFREVMGDYAVYLTPSDVYSWMRTIRDTSLGPSGRVPEAGGLASVTWSDHLRIVLTSI
ncbi:glycosyltransferase family 4 protein [Pseudotabrizicola sp. L79]|uniref:glycosyltransferase family 4 protein n=1 Tax=Pseudotabrizicola sp. L79 TaxID=3118402 RepID=UPI002F93CA39